eukprot:351457-Chlamydomonas_euryale.AAC.1
MDSRVAPAAAVVAVAFSRDNAVTHMQMKLASAASGGAPATRGLAAAAATAAPVAGSRSAAEAQLLHFFDVLAPCSGHQIECDL